MPDLDLLTEIHVDVKYIRKTLDEHIVEDKDIRKDFIKPLWEEYQQRQGEKTARRAGSMLIGYAINACIAITAAWAAVKALR